MTFLSLVKVYPSMWWLSQSMCAFIIIAKELHKTNDSNVQLCVLHRCVPRADSNLLDSQLLGHAPVYLHIVLYVVFGGTEVYKVLQCNTSMVLIVQQIALYLLLSMAMTVPLMKI